MSGPSERNVGQCSHRFFLPVWRSREFQSNRLGRDRFAANGKASGPLFGKCHYRVAAWEECGESENVPSFPKKKKS